MRKTALVLLLLCTVILTLSAQSVRLRIATTTSTQDSGLLTVLNPPFEKMTGITVDVIAVGSGKAIRLGENGDGDVVFVHDRKLEDRFVSQGFGVNRRDVMHNDFVIVGPAEDPAGIARETTAAAAFARIAGAGAVFISRGDASGTNAKELDLWGRAGMKPQGTWYKDAGQGRAALPGPAGGFFRCGPSAGGRRHFPGAHQVQREESAGRPRFPRRA
jgi:tungstate transport system substrate-binding protein